MKTTEEKNRMIAEFMGHKIPYIFPEYDTSWDWLIPVVDSIYNMGLDEHDTNEIGDITHALLDINISEVHKAVVQFIEWYNENK